jgi:hypothetical protein
MPILSPSTPPNYSTVADVNSRVRSITNDDNAQLYPDGSTQLLNAVRDAYNWIYGQVVRLQGQAEDKVLVDIVYTPAVVGEEQNLSSILPADFYQPISLEFRLNAGETYLTVDRRQNLPSRNNENLQRIAEWEFRGNTIYVVSSSQGGLIKLTYHPLLTQVNLTTDPITIQNAVEAIAHYAAYELFRRRGQRMQMMDAMGDDGSRNGGVPFGAKGFAAMLLDHIILNEQEIPRRGGRFNEQAVDTVSNRQYSG